MTTNYENVNDNNINKNDNNSNIEIQELQENYFTEDTIHNLADGLLEVYQPHLKKVQTQLKELTTKQKVLVEQLHNENLKLAWTQNSSDYQDMFKKIQLYRDKLINIKKEMKLLHDKSTKLKKRAVRLQQLKERDETAKKVQQQKEQDLIAK